MGWTNCLTTLYLSFLNYKMGMKITIALPHLLGTWEAQIEYNM